MTRAFPERPDSRRSGPGGPVPITVSVAAGCLVLAGLNWSVPMIGALISTGTLRFSTAAEATLFVIAAIAGFGLGGIPIVLAWRAFRRSPSAAMVTTLYVALLLLMCLAAGASADVGTYVSLALAATSAVLLWLRPSRRFARSRRLKAARKTTRPGPGDLPTPPRSRPASRNVAAALLLGVGLLNLVTLALLVLDLVASEGRSVQPAWISALFILFGLAYTVLPITNAWLALRPSSGAAYLSVFLMAAQFLATIQSTSPLVLAGACATAIALVLLWMRTSRAYGLVTR